MKFGIAIAAKRPMMATTIMISTNVNPDLRFVFVCIALTFFSTCGVNETTGGLLFITKVVHILPVANRTSELSNAYAKLNLTGKPSEITALEQELNRKE